MLLIAAGFLQTASAAERTNCYPKAVKDLQRLSPRGYAIYQAMADKKEFLSFVTCDDVQLGLSTAVHESVHLLTQDWDAFPLVNGGKIARPHQVSEFFAPKQIAVNFDAGDSYVQTYLRPGGASSATDFLYILDELNAYSHDLTTSSALVSLRRNDRDADYRDGLTALMAFLTSYVDTAQKKQPATWRGLMSPDARRAIQTLWTQAETALASSCGIPGFGTEDREFIAFASKSQNNAALAKVLGRPVALPGGCVPTQSAQAQ